MDLDPGEGRLLYGQDAVAYDVGRPEYPERVWEVLRSRCGLVAGSRVLEIGPGTGLVTRRLVAMGSRVTGVEPNASMSRFLRENLSDDGVVVVEAPFESAALPDGAFDLAVAGTSFHWVDRVQGIAKLRRVVRSGGSVAIWWMLFDDPSLSDEFSDAAEVVLGASPSSVLEPGRPLLQLDEEARCAELRAGGFVDVKSEVFNTEMTFDAARLRALYATMAIVLRRDATEQARVLDALERIAREQFGGRVVRTFVTAIYTASNP